MDRLRHARFLARLVLAWFALSLGVAMAAPFVQPQSSQLVCAAGGTMKVIVLTDQGPQEQVSPAMDCPLCASPAAPLSQPPAGTVRADALSDAPRLWAAARSASVLAAPPPARGPPHRA